MGDLILWKTQNFSWPKKCLGSKIFEGNCIFYTFEDFKGRLEANLGDLRTLFNLLSILACYLPLSSKWNELTAQITLAAKINNCIIFDIFGLDDVVVWWELYPGLWSSRYWGLIHSARNWYLNFSHCCNADAQVSKPSRFFLVLCSNLVTLTT